MDPSAWLDLVRAEFSAAWSPILRLVLAALLGGVIGLDRERTGKPAGLRTNMLICVGAALLTELSLRIAAGGWAGGRQADPARIAAQIVSGIGFLGAGTILQSRGHVIGLTTAATMWAVAAIGMAVGGGEAMLAIIATVIVVITLRFLPRLENQLATNPRVDQRIRLELEPDPAALPRIERLLADCGLSVEGLDVTRREDRLFVRYSTHGKERELDDTVRTLLGDEAVRRVRLD